MSMITHWDDAYANAPYIENANDYISMWAKQALEYRFEMQKNKKAQLDIKYGDTDRESLDIFEPNGKAKGICVFIHGGYWLAFDKSTWSHLAKGAVDSGYYVVIPSYELSPKASIPIITKQMIKAIEFIGDKLDGDLSLAGHSAGGHLVTRMVCQNIQMKASIQNRIKNIVSISGLHDLRPLLKTKMNDQFKLDEPTAIAESPALQRPIRNSKITCIVGANERPEFIRQNSLLSNIWAGLDAKTQTIEVNQKHHFNIIADLADKNAQITHLFINIGQKS